jgi:hypothetical protein
VHAPADLIFAATPLYFAAADAAAAPMIFLSLSLRRHAAADATLPPLFRRYAATLSMTAAFSFSPPPFR